MTHDDRCRLLMLTTLLIAGLAATAAAEPQLDWLDTYNVVWDTPGQSSWDSMPVGNGDIGLNVWTEPNGDLCCYLGKTDAWSENSRLLKLGRIRLRHGAGFADGPFRQELDLKNAQVIIAAGTGGAGRTLRVWVDAHRPVVNIVVEAEQAFDLEVQLETWRDERRPFSRAEGGSFMTMSGYDPGVVQREIVVTPDVVVDAPERAEVAWYHHNTYSVWPIGMKLHRLDELMDDLHDPLAGRTFGGIIRGDGLTRQSARKLAAATPGRRYHVQITLNTAQVDDPQTWLDATRRMADEYAGLDGDSNWQMHRRWWQDFWNRSHIRTEPGPGEFRRVTAGYQLQRFITACAGRGYFPIKFNGSIFTFDPVREDDGMVVGRGWDLPTDPDYRLWGDCYWWQNTRLPYWSMLAAGDFDLMGPLFKMYTDTADLARGRARIWYGVEGLFIPETMAFFGLHRFGDYGWQRENLEPWQVTNPYVSYYWQGGLELGVMMADYHAYTGDDAFARNVLVPWAIDVIRFYDQRFGRDDQGVLQLRNYRALETYFDADNPAPDLAGLHTLTDRLLALNGLLEPRQRRYLQGVRAALAPLPVGQKNDVQVILPASRTGKRSNMENPELYPVWPYGLHGLIHGDATLARQTYRNRGMDATSGWFQDAIHAARVGLTEQARADVVSNFTSKHPKVRFPAFWGPNYDWIPDQDHGAVSMIALQNMLMQCQGRRILLLPAWPRDWEVEFKLHAPLQTTVTGRYREGKLDIISVEPESRRGDITVSQ